MTDLTTPPQDVSAPPGLSSLYVKRWRTLILVPTSIKDEITALLSAAEAAQSARADALEEAARWHEEECARFNLEADAADGQNAELWRMAVLRATEHRISASAIRAIGKETGQ